MLSTSTHPPHIHQATGRGAEDGQAAERGKGEAQLEDEEVEEKEWEWEERDERGNMGQGQGDEKEEGTEGGRWARCSPHSHVLSSCLQHIQTQSHDFSIVVVVVDDTSVAHFPTMSLTL